MKSCMREAWKEQKGLPAAGQGWVGMWSEPLVTAPGPCQGAALSENQRDIWCVPGYFPHMLHFTHVWNVVCTSSVGCGCHSVSLVLPVCCGGSWGSENRQVTPGPAPLPVLGFIQMWGSTGNYRDADSVSLNPNKQRCTAASLLHANVVLAGADGIIVHGNNHSPFAWVICVFTDGICISAAAKASLESRELLWHC